MKKMVVSGMRPTGPLHIGHLVGALKNWVKLQEEYKTFFLVASLHALTSEYTRSDKIMQWTKEMIADWVSVGIDPNKSVLFDHSKVDAHYQLHLLLSMITPKGWLERVPTYKEQIKQLKAKNIDTYGFLGYPVLQTVDIILYKGELVPVGEDQVSHIELSREIVRKFNGLYGDVFPEPKPLLTKVPKLPGLDGRKMSKSYDNAIYLKEDFNEVKKKIFPMMTDTRRKRRSDPGVPEDCPVFYYHKAFSESEEIKEIDNGCRNASIGCIDCKKILIKNLEKTLVPIKDKRAAILKDKNIINDILAEGNKKAEVVAKSTMKEVFGGMGFAEE
jgi:tryptophanyl-tRNA synthetase